MTTKIQILKKTFSIFSIVYLSFYLVTYLGWKVMKGDFYEGKYPDDKIYFYINIILYIVPILWIVISLIYIKVKSVDFDWIIYQNHLFIKLLLSFLIVYSFSFLFNPIFRTFDGEIIDFTVNLSNWNSSENQFILIIFLGPLFEELLFRQILLEPFFKKNKIIFGILVTSILFAISHIYILNFNFNIHYILFFEMIVFGISLSVIRINFGLLFAILSHFFYNFLVILNNDKICDLYYLDYISQPIIYWILYIFSISFGGFSIYYLMRQHLRKKNMKGKTKANNV